MLNNGRITTKTYQKAMNLYLYIPSHSAHPPGMIKGMVYGLLHRYHDQNSSREDFLSITSLLFKRLVQRGWDKKFLRELFISSYEQIKTRDPSHTLNTQHWISPMSNDHNRSFFHLEYHPCDISRKSICALFDKECKDIFESEIGIREFTIAYSRPSNVADLVTTSKLYEVESKNVSFYLGEVNNI